MALEIKISYAENLPNMLLNARSVSVFSKPFNALLFSKTYVHGTSWVGLKLKGLALDKQSVDNKVGK